MNKSFAILLAPALAALAATAYASPAEPAFQKAGSIAGPDGGWDYASWDGAHGRLLVSHGNDVLMVDPSGKRPIRAIGNIAGAHAALAIPRTDQILVTSGHDASVRILDAASGRQLARIPVTADPDAALLGAGGQVAYVIGGDSGSISVVDLARRKETARISLKPGLEAPVLFGDGMIAVNNEDLGEIDLADLKTAKAAGRIEMPDCKGPTGLAADPASGIALSSCQNGKAVLIDLVARKVLQILPIGAGPDTVIWQARKHRFLVPCGRGAVLSVIGLADRKASVEPEVATDPGARTAALDPTSGRVFLPAARFTPPSPGQRRGTLVPGTFHVLVLAPARSASVTASDGNHHHNHNLLR